MNKRFWLMGLLAAPMILRMAEGEGGGGTTTTDTETTQAAAVTTETAAATTAAAAETTAAPWYKGSEYSAEEQQWLAAKGLTVDDPKEILTKLVKGHRSAEQRIGKGLDSIMDRPAQGQSHAEWARANAAALGLPEKEDGYNAPPPDFWPKDAQWDTELEAQARKLSFENGVSPDAHKAYVSLFAQKMADLDKASALELDGAKAEMMAELEKDYGVQTGARIDAARQGAQLVAEKAGLDAGAIERIGKLLSKETGDAQVIRFMASIRDMAGEDSMVQPHGGGSLTMTPADARQQLAQFESPEGEYGKAFAAGNRPLLNQLKAKREQLSKLAAG